MRSPDAEWRLSKAEKIAAFNPDGVGEANGRLFGLPFTPEESEVVVIPAPWEATVSYRAGTAGGPQAILNASPQLDLYDAQIPDAWRLGIALLPLPEAWVELNRSTREKAYACIRLLEHGGTLDEDPVKSMAAAVNAECARLHEWVYQTAVEWLDRGKIVAVLGGEHSVPLGLMRALTERYDTLGLIQIDAHADLRAGYEGFTYSHASIMHHAAQLAPFTRIVQIGVRDYCRAEADAVAASGGRLRLFEDRVLKRRQYEGEAWRAVCDEMLDGLPEHVYVSFDIDGLEPALCPHTGTPVPGGLDFAQVFYLLERLVERGHKIIGFDLCEVAAEEWDAAVGARVLYRLANLSALSLGRFDA